MRQSRRLLNETVGLPEIGEEPCAVCGYAGPGTRLGDVVSDNFTTWDLVFGNRASLCCVACAEMFRDRRFRRLSFYADAGGPREIRQAEFRRILASSGTLRPDGRAAG